MRCEPLRASRTGTSTWPAVSTVSAGITAKASLEPSTTLSDTVFTTFQYWSTARTVAVNCEPALWVVGVPDLPDPVPGWTVSPGSRICIAANEPASTVNELLAPVWGVVAKSEQVNETLAPAPRNVMSPVHTPSVNVMSSGEMLPSPVFA